MNYDYLQCSKYCTHGLNFKILFLVVQVINFLCPSDIRIMSVCMNVWINKSVPV